MGDKRFIAMLLCFIILLSVLGCGDKALGSGEGIILPAELTKEEKAMLDLVSVEQDFDIYDYKVSGNIKSFQLWLEAYENGEKLEDVGMFVSQQLNADEGRMAIVVDKEENYDWIVIFQHENGKASHSFSTDSEFETNSEYSQGSTRLAEKIDIENGEDIVLSAYIFGEGDGMVIYDPQQYIEDPMRLKQYDFIYLLKCRFWEKLPDEIHPQR